MPGTCTTQRGLTQALALMINSFAFVLLTLFSSFHAVASDYTHEVERAGYPIGKSDKLGPVKYPDFVKLFRGFPWRAQVGKSNGGAEATISVNSASTGTTLFVSVIGDSSDYAHVVGLVHLKHRPPLLGVVPRQPIRWVDMYVTDDPAKVESVFSTYFSSTLEATASATRAF
jgi:hypothetical protein